MLATVAAANIKKVQIKKNKVFIYSEAEPHAMYAIYKQTRTLCVLQYCNSCSVFQPSVSCLTQGTPSATG